MTHKTEDQSGPLWKSKSIKATMTLTYVHVCTLGGLLTQSKLVNNALPLLRSEMHCQWVWAYTFMSVPMLGWKGWG